MRNAVSTATLAAAAGFSLLSGCSSLPDFNGPLEASPPDKPLMGLDGQGQARSIQTVPTLSDVVTHIQCEIWTLPKPTYRTVTAAAPQAAVPAPETPASAAAEVLISNVQTHTVQDTANVVWIPGVGYPDSGPVKIDSNTGNGGEVRLGFLTP